MRVFVLSGMALLVLACGRPEPAPPAGAPAEQALFRSSFWDDGRAEVASYRARVERYGRLWDGHAVLITVTERFDADALVKDDGPVRAARPLEVLKLNHVLTLPTGAYTYHQMASVFMARQDLRPVRLTIGSQEWCGVTYKRLEVRDGRATLHGSSYFGGEGERSFDVPMDERTIWADALPSWLRALDLERRGERTVRSLASELGNRVRAPSLDNTSIDVGGASAITVPAGTYAAVPVSVVAGERRDVYWLERAAPHALVRWDRADGGVYELTRVERARYWEMHDPSDIGALEAP